MHHSRLCFSRSSWQFFVFGRKCVHENISRIHHIARGQFVSGLMSLFWHLFLALLRGYLQSFADARGVRLRCAIYVNIIMHYIYSYTYIYIYIYYTRGIIINNIYDFVYQQSENVDATGQFTKEDAPTIKRFSIFAIMYAKLQLYRSLLELCRSKCLSCGRINVVNLRTQRLIRCSIQLLFSGPAEFTK